MRGFFAKIAAIMRSFGSFMTTMVKVAGRWVARIVHVPAQPVAEAADAVPDTAPAKSEDFDAVRALAKSMAAGLALDAETLRGVPELTVHWLECMDRTALCKVICAQDEALARHLRGQEAIKGLVPYEKNAIADVTAVKDQPRPRDWKPSLLELYESGVSLAA